MPARNSSLSSRAFGEHADPRLIVAYQSHQDAMRFLSSALGHANGVALLQGPRGSGKTTIINEQRDWSSRDAAVALIDGNQLTPRELLSGVLSQFGIKTASEHDERLLQQLNNFVSKQTREGHSPILIIDNADRATESALRLLGWFAALDAGNSHALRIVLAGQERLSNMLSYGQMNSIARRNPPTWSLNPMTSQETMIYLRTRLIAAGGSRCEKVFPLEVCDHLAERSCGWPGALNRLAGEVVDRVVAKKPGRPVPRIIITRDGETVAERELPVGKYIIGRTELADIMIEDKYVSKTHAMLQVYGNAIVLLDLNSTNGTTVNSRLMQKSILKNNDIISLGRYRLKVENAPPITPEMNEQIRASDTVTMQTLEDIRRVRAKRNINALKNH